MADTPDQDSGDSSSAITSAASCLGNLREETHLHRASRMAVPISSLFYQEALDIQKLSLSSKLICQESKLKKKIFTQFAKGCSFHKMIRSKTVDIFGKKYCVAHTTTDCFLAWPRPTRNTIWQAPNLNVCQESTKEPLQETGLR